MTMAGPPFAAGENNQDLVVEEPRLFPQPRFLPPDDRQRNIKRRKPGDLPRPSPRKLAVRTRDEKIPGGGHPSL